MKLVLVIVAAASIACTVQAQVPEGYKLVWADEFNAGDGPDPAKWSYDTHRNKDGWYNNEAQYYSAHRAENARVTGGELIIESRRESLDMMADWGGQTYSSARLVSQGKADWTNGFFDVRANLPCGKGQWPAIWMLGNGQWPNAGEIDIMEAVGFAPDTIYANLHTSHSITNKITQGGEVEIKDYCNAYHNYQAEWTPSRITFFVDGKSFYHMDKPKNPTPETWPFDQPQYLILNIAIGGTWGGQQGIDDTVFPQQMQIDYVRVYQK